MLRLQLDTGSSIGHYRDSATSDRGHAELPSEREDVVKSWKTHALFALA